MRLGIEGWKKPLDLPRPRPDCPNTQLASNSLNKFVLGAHCARQGAGGRDTDGQGSTALTQERATDKFKGSWNTECSEGCAAGAKEGHPTRTQEGASGKASRQK